MDVMLIGNLKPGVRGARILSRVARIWDCSNPALQNHLISVDILFVDEEGSAIQVTVRPRDATWLRDSVEEGSVYTCSGFIVIAATNNYRACTNPNIISLSTGTTTFQRCHEEPIPQIPFNSFSFVEYDDLIHRAHDNKLLTDFIGQLTSMGPIEEVNVRNHAVEKRSLELQNLDGATVSATLWTIIAHQIHEPTVHQLMKKGSIVIILAGMCVTTFSRKATLTSKSATKIYMNLPHPATTNFRLGLTAPKEFTLTPPGLTLEQQIEKNRKTISELLLLQPKRDKGIRFTCASTIKDIHPFDGWWFPACPKCKTKVKTADTIYWCDNCNSYVDDTPDHWYKLELVVEDHTADCIFMIIGRHAEIVVGERASDLALTNPDPLILPHAIKELNRISKVFEVELMYRNSNGTSCQGTSTTFKVTRTFDAPLMSDGYPKNHSIKKHHVEESRPTSPQHQSQKRTNRSSSSGSTVEDNVAVCTK